MSQSSSNAKGPGSTRPKQTLIEDETQFKGVLRSQCPIVVKGAVEGEIEGPSLQVSESGSVAGTVKVESLQSQGTLAGTFEAGQVELSGSVKDKTVIRARSLEVKLASESGGIEVSFGECELEIGDVPTKEQAVSEAIAAAKPAPAAVKAEEEPAAAKDDAGGEKADDGERRARRESTSPATT